MAFVTSIADNEINKMLNNCIYTTADSSLYSKKDILDYIAKNWEEVEDIIEEEKIKKENQERSARRRKNIYLRSLVKHVHWSGNTCIVYWNDGTQTKAHWDPLEDFDPEKAILVCMARKLYCGTSLYNEVLKKYANDGWDHYEKEFFADEWNL